MTTEYTIGDLTRDEFLYMLGLVGVDDPKVAALAALSWGGAALKLVRVNATEDGWELHALSSSDVTTALGYTPVTDARTISTTAPLGGGGALSANLTLTISAATTGAAGSMSAADKTKLDSFTLDTDGTLAANSDAKLATQKATKTYVDQIIAAQDAMVFKGVIDCSANPNYPAADRGHTYRVSVAGKIGGASGTNVEAGDILLCLTDGTASGNQATVGANWSIIQVNLDGAVIGPASATDTSVALYDGATGKLIKATFLTFTGPASSLKTFTLPNASDTIACLGQAQRFSAAQTFINSSGIKIEDTDASHSLGFIVGSNLTGNRTLTITTGDASKTIDITDVTFAPGGVQFPATQVPSANANCLDDYEEGNWTPVIDFGGGTTGITYSVQSGRATKIGRVVFWEAHITLTNKGSSTGNAAISGLPYTCNATIDTPASSVLAFNMVTVAMPVAHVPAGATTISMWDFTGGTSATRLTQADFNNNSDIYLAGHYTV